MPPQKKLISLERNSEMEVILLERIGRLGHMGDHTTARVQQLLAAL